MAQIEFYSGQKKYMFTVLETKTAPNNLKQVAIGAFEGEAPPGCRSGQECCLVSVEFGHQTQTLKRAFAMPADREFIELFDFYGTHLRQVTLRDDAGEALLEACSRLPTAEELKNRRFRLIEPCYSPCDVYLDGVSKSKREKLAFFYRVLLGVQELYGNSICGSGIAAHRDLKARNILLAGDSPVLIDFSTVCLTNIPQGTVKTVLSKDNTAAENVLGAPENVMFQRMPAALQKKFDISEKTDVFSLGGLLAQMFAKNRGENPDGSPHRQGETRPRHGTGAG